MNKRNLTRFWLTVGLFFTALLMAACAGAGGSDHNGDDHGHDHDHDPAEVHDRIPNEAGAIVTITSPQDGATFSPLDQVLVEIAVDNFDLGEDGNHWHVYVDGVSYGMVMGGSTGQALPGLEPGEHEISVFLSIGTHEELEGGDSVTIVVEE